MKKINYLLIFICLGLLTLSCEEDNLQPEGQWELSSPEILLPTSGEQLTLDEEAPNETLTINWEEAESSLGYNVSYQVIIDDAEGNNTSTPIFTAPSSNNGAGTSLSISHEELDQNLALSGYSANSEADINIHVQAKSLSKSSTSTIQVSVVRFDREILPQTLFISGTATETGDDLSQAIELKRLTSSNGELANVFEVYTSLEAGNTFRFYSEQSLPALQYGGSNGNLESFGDPISVENTGTFRIRVNLDDGTYELLPIDFWSIVGTPINGGWGGDEPLEYQGNSIWEASINLISTGGFAFRANGNWDLLLKRIVGTTNELVLESDANEQGFSVEDIPNEQTGLYIVTLDLSADGYTYSFEVDDTVVEPIDTPSQLFLLENGNMIETFNQNGDVFTLDKFIPMQADNTYNLNTESDGSGISYSVNGLLAESATPDADKVTDAMELLESDDTFSLTNDRALLFNIDFSSAELTWTYYNFKLFHWQEWDDREEIPMNYVHPNTYTVNADLIGGFESKFISPWDFDLGSDTPSSNTGNLINGGGENLTNIDNDGTYNVTIQLDSDYETGTYEFIEQ